jgi:hypothetical protein
VGTGDFTFIQTNFLTGADDACCSQKNRGDAFADGPLQSISVVELHRHKLGHLAVADLNADGMLDAYDIAAFFNGARPKPVSSERRR